MRKALLLLALAWPVCAQTTAINDTIYQGGGQLWSGRMDISWPAFTTVAGRAIGAGNRTVEVKDGVMAVSLYPTESSSPSGVTYTVKFRSRDASWQEVWGVPVSATILTWRDVRRASSMVIYLSQLDRGGAVVGQALVWNGSAWAPGAGGGGGGGSATWGGIIGSLTDQTDLSNALAGKAALVHGHVIADVASLQSALNDKANSVHVHVISDITALQTALDAKQSTNAKGAANGYASLDQNGKVPVEQLPASSGITAIVQDTAPVLGGNLDMGGFSIGSVTPIEMGYLSGVTSGIQTQLNGKAASAHTHAGVYEPVDTTILRQGNLAGTGSAVTPARSDHNHNASYASLAGSYANPSWITSLAWSKISGSAHASTHATGQSDAIAPNTISAQRASTPCAVTPASSITLDATSCNAWSIALSSTAISTSTLSNARAGESYTIFATQDATGGRALPLAWMSGACPISTGANAVTVIAFTYDGTTARSTGCTSSDVPTLISGPARTTPGNAASGNLNCWFDSTAAAFLCVDSSGNVSATIRTESGATSNQFLTYVNSAGVVQRAQPAFSNLSGSATLAQLPAAAKIRTCEIHIWGSGTSQVLQDGDDEAASCRNKYGATLTITAVECWANAGSPTVTPIITGGAATSILSGALTCGTASYAAGTLNGTPTIAADGTIDANVTAAGGTATNIRIVVTMTL